MSECPGTDALTTIASALDWDVENGVRHLSSCPNCAQQLHALQVTYEVYDESENFAAKDVDRIMHKIAGEAEREHVRDRKKQTVANVIEALLAGGTAVTVLNASGSGAAPAASALTFAIVATALFAYRVFASSHAIASRSSSPSIQ
jgi:lysozyme family protein